MDNKNWQKTAVLLAVMVVAAVAWPRASIGADAKVLGASVCRRGGGVISNGLGYTSAGFQNFTGGTIDVYCSLPRDNTGNTTGLSDLEATVRNPTSGRAIINAISIDRNGNPLQVVRKDSTRAGSETLDFGAGLSVSSSKGSYVLVFSLPNEGMINSVYINEF